MESGFKTESIWLQRPKFSLLQVPKGLYTIPSALEFLESLNLYLQSAVRIVGSELYVLISLASDYFLFPSKIFPFFFLPFFSLSSYFGLQWYLTRYSSTSICLSVFLSLSHTHTQSVTRIHFFPHAFPWSQTSSCRIYAFAYNLKPTESFGLPQVVEVYFKDTTGKERKSPQEVRRLSSTGPGFTKTWNTDSSGLPEAALMPTLLHPPKWARAVLYSSFSLTLSASSLNPSFSFLLPLLLFLPTFCLSQCLDLRAELSLIVWVLPPS